MNKYFNKIKLGELTEIIAGGDKPKIFSENKTSINTVPVFANAEGNNGLQGYTNLPRIIEPAVTISARGSKVGFAALRKQPFFPIVRLLTLIPQKDKLDVDYLFYNLKLNRQNGTGSGQPQITIPEISDKIISVPPLFTQQKIASVLSALDAKIELNNRINAELEAMAKTLYDYWFVQFDFPNKNDKPYKTSGGKMAWNDELKRQIPEGWEVKELHKIAKCLMGQSPKGESYNQDGIGIPLLNGPADYENGVLKGRTYTTEPTRLCQKDDLVLCIRATIGNLVYSEQEFCLGRGVAAVRANDKRLSELIYFLLIQEIERFKVQATGSIIVGITKDDLIESKCLIPKDDLINSFHNLIKPQFDKVRINLKENQKLTELRDWLLPMLMNGQVKVN
jgi:type I restriction enzyme S subunit